MTAGIKSYFFRPSIGKLIASIALTLITFYFSIVPNSITALLRIEVFEATQTTIFRFIFIFIFWQVVSYLIYSLIWSAEYLYVKIYNHLVIRPKYFNEEGGK